MADWGGFLNKSSGFGGGSMRNEDFDEEDVWGVTMERERERDYLSPKMSVSKESSASSSARRISTSPRKIPRTNSIALPSLESDANVVQRSSAPIDIPDWSKIYGKKIVEEGVNKQLDCGYGDHYRDDYGEDEDDMIPPHEWIARKLARSQITSFSMCEGLGRTLKGRDLSKVRNAILTKTGFIE
ncbi:Senescence regulator S40 [Spatholobus suberectus]|nr:Senescence regulator S40 [Spatholobus suberectus]